jgi:hypothetical protein
LRKRGRAAAFEVGLWERAYAPEEVLALAVEALIRVAVDSAVRVVRELPLRNLV